MRVLVIDDAATFGELLKLHLSSLGHDVAVATDGVKGLAEAQRLIPDVIVIDYHMPGANGAVVASHLAKSNKTAHIPLIFLTGAPVDEVLREVFAFGALKIISKTTLTETELLESLEEALASNPLPADQESVA